MDSYTIERIGDDNVIRRSDDDLARHGLKVGDRVEATLSKDALHDQAMRQADDLMDRYRDALAELAK